MPSGRTYHREYARRRREKKRALGQCFHCNLPAENNKTLCAKHAQKNREKASAKYYSCHEYRERIHENARAWIKNNRERWRELSNRGIRKLYKKRRQLILDAYGNECACCGETEAAFLALDHKNGGGNKHRKEVGPTQVYRWVIENNFPSDFQLLCHNCNNAKYRLGVCPHQTKRELNAA